MSKQTFSNKCNKTKEWRSKNLIDLPNIDRICRLVMGQSISSELEDIEPNTTISNKLIVFGFIRMHWSNILPMDIINICTAYYGKHNIHLIHSIDKNRTYHNNYTIFQLNENNTIIKSVITDKSRYYALYLSNYHWPIHGDIYWISIKYIKGKYKSTKSRIGIVNRLLQNWVIMEDKGYPVNSSWCFQQGDTWNKSEIITIKLDLSAYIVCYYKTTYSLLSSTKQSLLSISSVKTTFIKQDSLEKGNNYMPNDYYIVLSCLPNYGDTFAIVPTNTEYFAKDFFIHE